MRCTAKRIYHLEKFIKSKPRSCWYLQSPLFRDAANSRVQDRKDGKFPYFSRRHELHPYQLVILLSFRFIPFYFLKFSTTRPHLTRTFYSIIYYYVMMNAGAICDSSGSCGNDTLESSSSRNNLNLGAQQFLNKDSFCVFFAHTMIHSNPVDEQCYYDYKEKMASSFVL